MDVDELYGLAPERFVPERNALARELRRAGRRDEAAEVAALRKPSVAARAVNQLARDHAPQLRRLFEAADALSEVQSQVLAGQADGRTLGEAAERERGAVSALVDVARELLVAEGQDPSTTVLERVSETLHAAALEDEVRPPVAQGRLERELRHAGLGIGGGGAMHAPAKTKRGAPAAAPPETKAGKQAAASDKRAEQAAARRRAEAHKRAAADEADARRHAERAAKALQAAERRRSRAADALEEAETALNAARRAAKAGEEDHRKAERELRRLEP